MTGSERRRIGTGRHVIRSIAQKFKTLEDEQRNNARFVIISMLYNVQILVVLWIICHRPMKLNTMAQSKGMISPKQIGLNVKCVIGLRSKLWAKSQERVTGKISLKA